MSDPDPAARLLEEFLDAIELVGSSAIGEIARDHQNQIFGIKAEVTVRRFELPREVFAQLVRILAVGETMHLREFSIALDRPKMWIGDVNDYGQGCGIAAN